MEKLLPLIHPGQILGEEFMAPMGISAYRLAKDTHISQTRVGDILHGTRGITVDTALRLGKYFGTTPEFWMNLQRAHDLEKEQESLATEIAGIPTVGFDAKANPHFTYV